MPDSQQHRPAEKPAGMRPQEYERIRELLEAHQPKRTLEIGMANGDSAVEICRYLANVEGASHVAVDPFQTAPEGWDSRGIQAVEDAGFIHLLELKNEPDYIALPKLVEAGRRFDFILIDGWHSFDYTLIDIFFADLLLKPGGVLAVHDTGWPNVYKACRFLSTHKPYELLSPPPAVEIKPLIGRLARRALPLVRGPAFARQQQARRNQWFSIAAYRKIGDHQVPDAFYRAF